MVHFHTPQIKPPPGSKHPGAFFWSKSIQCVCTNSPNSPTCSHNVLPQKITQGIGGYIYIYIKLVQITTMK